VTSSPVAESAAKPWEVARDGSNVETVVPESSAGPVQQPGSRPWEARGTLSTAGPSSSGYGGYGGGTMYGSSGYGYGNSMYGNSGMYGGYGYGGGNSMYGNSGMYGSSGYYGARPMYGGAGPMYGGVGPMYGGMGAPVMDGASSPWQAMLGGIGSMVHFFGRLSFLVDENAHAVHFFISALLQLLDRFGSLYGELARFILRLLGFRRKEAGKEEEGSTTKRVGHMASVWNDGK